MRISFNLATTSPFVCRQPAPPALAEVLSEVFAVNTQLQPHLVEYHSLLTDDRDMEGDVSIQEGMGFNVVFDSLGHIATR